LSYAAQEGKIECVRILISSGSNIDSVTNLNNTPLYRAAYNGRTDVVDLLIKAGANIEKAARGGKTPLLAAAKYGRIGSLELLIHANANINHKDDLGWTALSLARHMQFSDCENLLLNANAIDIGRPKFPIDDIFTTEKVANEYQDVDEMKIQTMYKMVDECVVIAQGKDVTKKVLYLTNKQAIMFDEVSNS
jgi:ankyrin repeat protein